MYLNNEKGVEEDEGDRQKRMREKWSRQRC